MSNGSASTSNRCGKAKTTQQWTTTEEITLCTAWCNAMDKYDTGDSMKRGFWSEVFANFEKEIGGLFEDTISSSPNGNIQFVLKLLRLVSFTIVSNGLTRAADEHEIGDEYLIDGYLTAKEQQQLLLDEETLRETLEEETRSKYCFVEPRYAPLTIKQISEASHSVDDKSNFVLSGAHVVNFKSLPSGGNVEAGEIPSLADLGINHTANMSWVSLAIGFLFLRGGMRTFSRWLRWQWRWSVVAAAAAAVGGGAEVRDEGGSGAMPR
ncbi:hypothetical protein Tco_0371171 [Tanacetum coccineum]